MFANLLLPLLLQSSPALAGGSELSFNWGRLGAPDDNWGLLSYNDQLRTVGVRAGYGLNDHLSVVAGWQRGSDGGAYYAGDDDDYYYEYDTSSFNMALTTNRLSVGPKARVEIFPWFVPYATVQASLLVGSLRLDDDLDSDENLNQIRSNALAPGAVGAAGLELIARRSDRLIRPALGFEAGYGWMASLNLDPVGDMAFRGFYGSWTLGARF